MLSVKDNGYANEWNVGDGYNATTAKQITSYFKPYLKIIKDCETNSGCLTYSEISLLNGNKNNVNYDANNKYYKMILSDGSYIWWRGSKGWCQVQDGAVVNTCVAIWTDINGSKQPNIMGIDIFYIFITPGGVKPQLIDDCYLTGAGWGCLNYILKNGNMDYLH